MRAHKERGATNVEFVILLPAMLLFVTAVIASGRAWLAHAAVQQLADSAARQASISRTAGEASTSAQQLVQSDAAGTDLVCAGGVRVEVDTSGFGVPVGLPAHVTARVSCAVQLADLLMPGIPGTIDADATSISTLDRYRSRS